MKRITLLYDESMTQKVAEDIIPQLESHMDRSLAFKSGLKLEFGEDEFIITYLPDELLKEFLPIVVERSWKVGFLPHPKMVYAKNGFGVSSNLKDAITNILNADSEEKVDLLMANGRPVFDTVVVGQALSLVYGSPESIKIKRSWGKLMNFFRLFEKVYLHQYTFEYKENEEGKKEELNTAALGMIMVQHGKSSVLSRKVLGNSYVSDGKMHCLILAPESILGLAEFWILGLFRSGKNPRLPPFAAHIKTNKLLVRSKDPMELSVDDVLMSSKEVELEVVPKILNIVPGKFLDTEVPVVKEIYRTQSLPRGEKRDELLKGPLPLINHATSEEFKDLFTILRNNSRPKSTYLVLMFLSTFIATLGLFSNSSPVVIGAMILAPLMAPIISFSMGLLRQDGQLIRNSLKSIGLGLLLGYLCAIIITLLTPLNTVNIQILARLRPNLLDLGIAVGSGVAGAYAHSKKEVAQTLAGVAIAVALVPPLAVSGIGVGWMDWRVFSGALLLLVTNLTGMVLAAALTFLFLGFSPFRLAKKGLFISLLLVVGVSAPLAFGFSRMVRENKVVQNLRGYKIDQMVLRDIDVMQSEPLKLAVKIITEKPLDETDLEKVKNEIEERLGEDVELEITVGIKM